MPVGGQGTLEFNHTIQIAHRLFLQPGKCQQIHGHSMRVILILHIQSFDKDKNGYATNDIGGPLEFGAVKKRFRAYLDAYYDHSLLLNRDDPWARTLIHIAGVPSLPLPGLVKCDGDPSTENIAKWIANWCANEFNCAVGVTVQETETNSVSRNAWPTEERYKKDADDTSR